MKLGNPSQLRALLVPGRPCETLEALWASGRLIIGFVDSVGITGSLEMLEKRSLHSAREESGQA